jgi:3-phenylpropionate/trans-cinnamate dioxygenase ferredoxin subunit
MSDYVRAIALSDVATNKKVPVEIGGTPLLVCNVGGKIHVVSNICSHAEEKLDCGRMGNGWIACPVHGARFELATGRAMNPPATKPIPVYEHRIADDWIEVKL